jgi:hypothetical protein
MDEDSVVDTEAPAQDPNDVVSEHGLKPLFRNYMLLGITSAGKFKANEFDQLHRRVTNDLLKLVKRMKDSKIHAIAVLNLDGDPINALSMTVLKTSGIPIVYLTGKSPEKANNKDIWYVNDLVPTFVKSCTMILNYGNEEISDLGYDYDETEVIDRPIEVKDRAFQNLETTNDPYGEYWSKVHQLTRYQRMAYRGIRINQVIDLRPRSLIG